MSFRGSKAMPPSNESSPESDLWIFGYGSVIWKNTDIPHTQSATVFVQGFKRRFWQGSNDHRGTPDAPGRVVSLYSPKDFDFLDLSRKDAKELDVPDEWRVYGVAFLVTPEHRDSVIETLDYREKNGYVPVWLPLYVPDNTTVSGHRVFVQSALTYIAPVTNTSFLGFATHEQIAAHIAKSVGPSGTNLQYVRNLHRALISLGHPDLHIASILSKLPGNHAVGDNTAIS